MVAAWNHADDVAFPPLQFGEMPLGDCRFGARNPVEKNMHRHNEFKRPHANVHLAIPDLVVWNRIDERRQNAVQQLTPTNTSTGISGGAFLRSVNGLTLRFPKILRGVGFTTHTLPMSKRGRA